jgi:hypothetical protein
MSKTCLNEEFRFPGRVKNKYGWCSAIMILKMDLKLQIYLPMLDYQYEGIPQVIEGRLKDWDVDLCGIASKISISQQDFNYFDEKIRFTEDEKNVFSEKDLKLLWAEITFQPATCSFTKVGITSDVPHAWGLTYYPEAENKILQHFFIESRDDRSPRNLPNIFSGLDHSLYFKSVKQWTISSIHERLQLLTLCLSFFTGTPLSYERLVGRYKDNVIYIQFRNESNPNAYICPSLYNGRLELRQNSLSTFSSVLVKKIEEHFNDPNKGKLVRLLSYFKMLYMAYYKEAKIALSFQLMESLARFYKMQLKNSRKNDTIKKLVIKFSKEMFPACIGILQREIKPDMDDFDVYLGKALDVFELEESLKIEPAQLKEIARKYRNNVFHGDFFEDMKKIGEMVKSLPEGWQRDLPLIFESIVSAIGANLILGIDFGEMIAIKRSMY